jgi:hypothetical protein
VDAPTQSEWRRDEGETSDGRYGLSVGSEVEAGVGIEPASTALQAAA